MTRQTRTITVLVVDDQPLLREALGALIGGLPGLAVAGQAGTDFETLSRYQALRPDVVVVNLRGGGSESLVTVRSLRSLDPRARIVGVTDFEKDADIPPAVIESGIRGRLLRGMGAPHFVETIRAVARGGVVLPGRRKPRPQAGQGSPLTAREIEVVQQIARGLRNCDIGAELGITEGTVKIHVNHILGKLGVADRKTAVLRSRAGGLLPEAGHPRAERPLPLSDVAPLALGSPEPNVLRSNRTFGGALWRIGPA